MGKFLFGIAVALFSMSANAGCQFSWHSYGDKAIHNAVERNIGRYVTDHYCNKFNARHEIVMTFDAYTLRNMCVGHASVSMRKRGTKTQQQRRFTQVVADTDCRSFDGARQLATEAALDGVKDLMINLNDYKVR